MPIYQAVSAHQGSDERGGQINYGYFEGKYEDVLAYARQLPNWKNYDNEGSLYEIKPKKIDHLSIKKRVELLARKIQLKQELEDIEKQL